jgi:hypothetical protein
VELPVPFIVGILVSLGWWKALACLDRFGELHCNDKAPPGAFGNVASAPISMAGVLNPFQTKPSVNHGSRNTSHAKKVLCHKYKNPRQHGSCYKCPENKSKQSRKNDSRNKKATFF